MSKLAKYIEAKAGLDKFKKLEKDLRIELLEELFPDTVEGTVSTELDGCEIKGTFKLSHKLSQADYEEEAEHFSDAEMDCVAIKASLKMGAYNKLEPSERENIDACITVSPAMPTITIKQIEEE